MINNKTILTHKSFTMQVFMCVTTPSFPVYLSTVKKAKKAKKIPTPIFQERANEKREPHFNDLLKFQRRQRKDLHI